MEFELILTDFWFWAYVLSLIKFDRDHIAFGYPHKHTREDQMEKEQSFEFKNQLLVEIVFLFKLYF